LLHNDRDFDKIANHTNLEVVKPAKAPSIRPKSRG